MSTQERIKTHSRSLRKENTDAEYHLWRYLRGRRLGQYKFKRQVPIGRYIVDLVCLRKKLVIELDGGQHMDPLAIAYDEERTAFLEEHGYKVLRFWNNEILKQTQNVLDVILHELESRG